MTTDDLPNCLPIPLGTGAPPAIGHRLLVAAYPSAYILLGALGMFATDARRHPSTQPALLALVVLLGLTHVLESLGTHPDYVTYFGPIAGSKTHGHFHLLGDSSDGGQDVPNLERWLQMHAEPLEPAYLAYCGEDSPYARAVHARRLPALPNLGCPSSDEPFDFQPPRLEPRQEAADVRRLPQRRAGSQYSTGTSPPTATPEAGETAEEAVEAVEADTVEAAHVTPGAVAGAEAAETAKAASEAAEAKAEAEKVLNVSAAPVTALSARTAAQEAALAETKRLLLRASRARHGARATALVARRSERELEAEAVLLPGLYCIEANQLHGLSSTLRGPWTDIAEGTYQLLRQEGLHTRRLASALRFARLCALLRRLPPVGSAGGTILAWRLSADELAIATDEAPAELIASDRLTPGVRREQELVLVHVLRSFGLEGVEGVQLERRRTKTKRKDKKRTRLT